MGVTKMIDMSTGAEVVKVTIDPVLLPVGMAMVANEVPENNLENSNSIDVVTNRTAESMDALIEDPAVP